jgi:formylmethanofuran dehydrogenase subunit C
MAELTAPVVPVPEIRDYQRINAQVAQWLDEGHRRVRLTGVDGQRLLLSGLSGSWPALVEIEGDAGPELGAGVRAPNLVMVCRGNAADGAGRDLAAGCLVITGTAGDAVAYRLAGGTVVVQGAAGHRAGLEMSGGSLVLCGSVGRLAADRQRGGRIYVVNGPIGPHPAHASTGGRLICASEIFPGSTPPTAEDLRALADILSSVQGLAP